MRFAVPIWSPLLRALPVLLEALGGALKALDVNHDDGETYESVSSLHHLS